MSNLSAFLQPNVERVENHRYVVSPRFKGEDGKPVEWEICCISADEYSRIQSECMKKTPVPGKKKQFTQDLDVQVFQTKMCARCTVFPDLNNAQLQDSWGVATPQELLGKMLVGGELDDYMKEVLRINGFQEEDELVNEAKN